MRRTSLDTADCPIARSLDVIGDWWSLLIVRDALGGPKRFGDFQKGLGMAKNILSARLKSLTAQGILDAVPASDGGAYKDYVLTEKGRALFPVLVALREWGETYQFSGQDCPVELVERVSSQPVGRLELRGADGRVLGPADTMIVRRGQA